MKGDFSRRTFEQANHYSAVLIEQGRMLTDADLEEEHRILARRIEREAADLIGGCGGPIGNAGFAIALDAAHDLTIGAGRYYVDGILVENDADIAYAAQVDYPAPPLPEELPPGRYVVFLDVWRRLITALDDSSIREVALDGPTTSVRERIAWQVGLVGTGLDATCLWDMPALEETTGRMVARTNPVTSPDDPCLVPATAGFKGLENQFYRVEIHDNGQPYNLAGAADSFAVVIPPGTSNKVEADGGTWTPSETVEIYRAGTGFNPLEAELFIVVAVDTAGPKPVLTLNRTLQKIDPGDDPTIRKVDATFVWSRDNGSVATSITNVTGAELTVHDLGPDEVRGFRVGQWVEIIDNVEELNGRPGGLAWVEEVDPGQRMVRLTADATVTAPWLDPANRPAKLRRWDGAGAIRFQNPAPHDEWIALENGIQIRFITGHYRTGDFWHFAARAASLDPDSGQIDWPQAGGGPKLREPHGIDHHVCKLAIVQLVDSDADGKTDQVTLVDDCRDEFPAVTELTTLLYVGGDGQEGTPNPTDPTSRSVNLGAPLQVRVANGEHPVPGALVRFSVEKGNGQLQGTNLKVDDAPTDPAGVATCEWQLDGTNLHQQVDAQLLDAGGNIITNQIVRFHARLNRASEVSYDPANCRDLQDVGAITVQRAIDELCKRESGGGCCCVVVGPDAEYETIEKAIFELLSEGETDLCLCLLPGDHELPGGLSLDFGEPFPPVNLTIKGCGPATRLTIRDNVYFRRLWSFVLDGLEIFAPHPMLCEIDHVREVRIDSCRMSGSPERRPLLKIIDATNVYVGNSTFEVSHGPLVEVAEILSFYDRLSNLFTFVDWRDFVDECRFVAMDLISFSQSDRENFWRQILSIIESAHLRPLSMGEENAYRRFAYALAQEDVDPFALVDHLIAIREEGIRAQLEIAVEIGWTITRAPDPGMDLRVQSLRDPGRTRASEIVIENNVLIGGLSFYGEADYQWESEVSAQILNWLEQALQPDDGQGPVMFDGLLGVAHVRDNHLTRMFVSTATTEALGELPQFGGRAHLETAFKSLHCTDNVFDHYLNVFVAEHSALTSNNFTLDAVRDLGSFDDAGITLPVAIVIGDTGTYVGNHGRGTVPGVTTDLRDITRASAEGTNLELNVV